MEPPNATPNNAASAPKVLIVDDNADGRSALQVMVHQHPHIVLLDIMMPGEMDGLQVLDRIKRDPELQHTVVAMLTARGQASDGVDARKRGADAYFIKPFSPSELKTWIDGRVP
jgi:CheY-like chemotaxis protein